MSGQLPLRMASLMYSLPRWLAPQQVTTIPVITTDVLIIDLFILGSSLCSLLGSDQCEQQETNSSPSVVLPG